MAQASAEEKKPLAGDVDIDPDFEPQKRPRSCTWPLPRPECNTGKQPEPGEADIIPEEEDDESSPDRRVDNTNTQTGEQTSSTRAKQSHCCDPPGPALNTTCNDKDSDFSRSPSRTSQALAAAAPDSGVTTVTLQQPRKSSARRNAWGNYSYADLITQAIESSPEKRLTLAQIYDWMVRSVPYFKDKGDSNSSAGWKVGELHIRSIMMMSGSRPGT